MVNITYTPLGDQAIVIDFGKEISLDQNRIIHKYREMIESAPFQGFCEAVPAYNTLTVFYDPIIVGTPFPYITVKEILQSLSPSECTMSNHIKTVEIPVCYEAPFAPDLEIVASHNGLTPEEVIELHSQNLYHVHFLGFTPGFPFLGGMNERLTTPRKSTPRLKVPRGSVGIAGNQTGIYPLESPGGWQIIGRTPSTLFNVHSDHITLISPGDQVRFTPINKEQFLTLEEKL